MNVSTTGFVYQLLFEFFLHFFFFFAALKVHMCTLQFQIACTAGVGVLLLKLRSGFAFGLL